MYPPTAMRLAEILAAERITVGLATRAKAPTLRAMASLFAAEDAARAEQIARVFEEREALASTGVGSGVAIPHGRISGINTLMAAVGISADGVEFESIDGRPVHIIVAVLGPERQSGDHLKALARFSRILRREPVRDRLLRAADAAAALAILLEADG